MLWISHLTLLRLRPLICMTDRGASVLFIHSQMVKIHVDNVCQCALCAAKHYINIGGNVVLVHTAPEGAEVGSC